MARLPKKKRSRAEAIQDAKTTAALKVIRGRSADLTLRQRQDIANEHPKSFLFDFDDFIDKLQGLDQHVIVFPQDAIRLGVIMASVYVSCVAPAAVRQHGRRPIGTVGLGDLHWLITTARGAIVAQGVNKLVAWIVSALGKGRAGLEALQQLINDVRIIAPLTGEVYDDEYLLLQARATEFFVPVVVALFRLLVRKQNKKRTRREKVYSRRVTSGDDPSLIQKLLDQIKLDFK